MVGWKHQCLSTLKCCLSVTREVASASRGSGSVQSALSRDRACSCRLFAGSVILVPLNCSEQFNKQRQICTSDVSMLISRAFRPATSLLQTHVARYTSMARDYSAAVAALNTLQSNFSIVDAIRKSGKGMNQNAIPEMIDWVKTGYEV
jgi:hypothetical protein